MSSDDPAVPIVCPQCDNRASIPFYDLPDKLDRHNERLHNGTKCATIDLEVAYHLADLVATDLDLLG